jgi:hypothetical protein
MVQCGVAPSRQGRAAPTRACKFTECLTLV